MRRKRVREQDGQGILRRLFLATLERDPIEASGRRDKDAKTPGRPEGRDEIRARGFRCLSGIERMIYFRTYARSIGCVVDRLGDRDVWNYIRVYQGRRRI